MRRWWLAGCLVVCACAAPSARSPASTPAAPQAAATGTLRADPHAEITQLSQQIDQQRGQLGLAAPPPAAACATCPIPESAPVSSATDPSCHPGASQTCQDSCGLADAICSNAQKICDLARQLPGDVWAANKCAEGQATCDSAHGKCCACSG